MRFRRGLAQHVEAPVPISHLVKGPRSVTEPGPSAASVPCISDNVLHHRGDAIRPGRLTGC